METYPVRWTMIAQKITMTDKPNLSSLTHVTWTTTIITMTIAMTMADVL